MLLLLAFSSDLTRIRFPFIALGFAFTFIGFVIYATIQDVSSHIQVAYFATFMMCWGTSAPSVILSTVSFTLSMRAFFPRTFTDQFSVTVVQQQRSSRRRTTHLDIRRRPPSQPHGPGGQQRLPDQGRAQVRARAHYHGRLRCRWLFGVGMPRCLHDVRQQASEPPAGREPHGPGRPHVEVEGWAEGARVPLVLVDR